MPTLTRSRMAPWLAAFVCLVVGARAEAAANFDSKSNGSDGPLDFSGATSGTTVVFDPNVLHNASGLPLDPDGDNIYHFTTITIPTGVTVKLRAWKMRNPGPVYWLATGDVDIEGTLDLSGDSGHPKTPGPSAFNASSPGPGGFAGGMGKTTSGIIGAGTAGSGPGGGALQYDFCNAAGNFARGNRPYGNLYLIPLVGGSGGRGDISGGGAGGGSMLLASTTKITLNGAIQSWGGTNGNGCGDYCSSDYSYPGSGGAIRVLAPSFTGAGVLSSRSAAQTAGGNSCGWGWLRLETMDNTFTGTVDGGVFSSAPLPSIPIGLPLGSTAGLPTLNLVSIGGQSVPAAPTGLFTNPDVSVNSSLPLTINVAATNVPPGTSVTVQVLNYTLGMQSATTTLAGTLGSTTGTATVTLPPGVSVVYASATWTN